MITKAQRQNVEALIRQKHQPLLDIIEKYQAGGKIDELTANWKGFGTNGEAVAEYVAANYKQNKKRSKSTPKTEVK